MKKLVLFWVFLAILGVVHSQKCDCGPEISNFVDPLSRISHVNQATHQFIDEFGRSRWFHGSNVVTKSAPYHPDLGGEDVCNATLPSPFCDTDMDYLQSLGVNVVRLGVMWPGAEPERGVYNCTYFCVIHGIIQSLASRGIYTLIGVHQDVLARQFCQEGVPDIGLQTNPGDSLTLKRHENGIPDPWSQCWEIGGNWFLSYFSIAVSDAFQRLYSNHDGLRDSFAAYWAKIAEEFKDYKSVMGYNLLNEPWAGNIYKDPTLLIPGVADRVNLYPVWDQVTTSIRAVDEDTLIFFEGVTWDIVDGHPQVPGGNGSKSALSYHFYAPPQLGLHSMFQNRLRDHGRLSTGGILTEFRMWAGEGAEDKEDIDGKIRDTLEAADKYLQSWMGWGYRSVLDRSETVRRHYARTYPTAVAGTLVGMGFNEDTADFWTIWTVDKSTEGGSEVRLCPEIYYPDGWEVRVSPSGWAEWTAEEEESGVVNVKVTYLEGAVDGGNITVRVLPKWDDKESGADMNVGGWLLFGQVLMALVFAWFA